jgi:hypothetical protein
MAAPIGSLSFVNLTTVSAKGLPASGPSPAALQAQLDRANTQLDNWIYCPSGKTPEGKKIIQTLESNISLIKTQIQAQAQSTSLAGTQPAGTSRPTSVASDGSTRQKVAPLGYLGTRVNTVA